MMVSYFRRLISYFVLVVLVALITLTVMYIAVIRNFKPSYESTALLLVGRQPERARVYEAYEMLQEVQIAEKIVRDIPALVLSAAVREEVNNELTKSNYPESIYDEVSFKKLVTTEILQESRVVSVTVRNNQPASAMLAAATAADTVGSIIRELTGQEFIQIVGEPEVSNRIAGLGFNHLWLISAAGGVLLGMAIVLMLTMVEKYSPAFSLKGHEVKKGFFALFGKQKVIEKR